MKDPADWTTDDWVVAIFLMLLAGGMVTQGKAWWATNGRQFLLDHHILLPTGQGLLDISSYGAIDAARILATVAFLVLLAILARNVAAPALRKNKTEKDVQDALAQLIKENR